RVVFRCVDIYLEVQVTEIQLPQIQVEVNLSKVDFLRATGNNFTRPGEHRTLDNHLVGLRIERGQVNRLGVRNPGLEQLAGEDLLNRVVIPRLNDLSR